MKKNIFAKMFLTLTLILGLVIGGNLYFNIPVKAFESKIVNVNSNYTIKYGNQVLLVDSSTNDWTLTLPRIGNGVGQAGQGHEITIIDTTYTASQHTIIISPSSTNKIDNASSSIFIDENGGQIILQSDGVSNWLIKSNTQIKRLNGMFSMEFANTINGKTTGAINVFKVPQGKKAVFFGADVVLKNKTGTVMVVGSGKFQVDGGADLTNDASLTGVTTIGSLTHYSPFSAGVGAGTVIVGGAGGTWIQFNLTSAYTVTSATLSGSVQGYLLN